MLNPFEAVLMTGAHWVGNCSTHSLTNFGFFLSLATAAISIHPGGEKTYTYLQKNDYNYESFCYLVDHQNVHKKFLWLYTRPKWIYIHLNAFCIRTTARYFSPRALAPERVLLLDFIFFIFIRNIHPNLQKKFPPHKLKVEMVPKYKFSHTKTYQM